MKTDMENKNFDNIELRSEKVRHIIGIVPPRLVRTGTVVITFVVVALAIAFYTIHYPITIEAQGEMEGNDTLIVRVPYKYLYLFDEQRNVIVNYEGRDDNDPSSVYPIYSYDDRLLRMGENNYFLAKVCVGADSARLQSGQKAEVRIVVSDRTLWQQITNS